jgi:hypothetical protein
VDNRTLLPVNHRGYTVRFVVPKAQPPPPPTCGHPVTLDACTTGSDATARYCTTMAAWQCQGEALVMAKGISNTASRALLASTSHLLHTAPSLADTSLVLPHDLDRIGVLTAVGPGPVLLKLG